MSSSKSLFEDVKWALSNRKLGSFKMALKKARKMHKYAKTAFIKKEDIMLLFAQIRDSIQWVNGDSPNRIVILGILIFQEGKVFERAPIGIIQMLVVHK